MLVREDDLTRSARIRRAALELFALNGVEPTSIRDVARAAGVSPGLVQHHFKTKSGLRGAVDDEVLALIGAAFAGFGDDETADLVADAAERITRLVDEQRLALTYLGRAVVEGDESGMRIFDGFAEIAKTVIDRLAAEGALREGVDPLWAPLNQLVLNLGTVLFEPAISRHLAEPFFQRAQLERWSRATTDLFRYGALRERPT